MSLPISGCMVSKACKGNAVAREEMFQRLLYNQKQGHMTLGGCECKPHCPIPTEAEKEALKEWLDARVEVFGTKNEKGKYATK